MAPAYGGFLTYGYRSHIPWSSYGILTQKYDIAIAQYAPMLNKPLPTLRDLVKLWNC